MAYENSNGSSNYKKLIKSNPKMKSFFKKTFFLNLFKLNKLTEKGNKIKKEISRYLNEINKNIDSLLLNDTKKGLELLLSVGGNIFLLKKLNFELLKKIDKELLNQQKELYSETYDSDSDWWLYMDSFDDDYMFDSYFEEFDSTLDSFDSEFDASSCSSCDSGCSSCGGCD